MNRVLVVIGGFALFFSSLITQHSSLAAEQEPKKDEPGFFGSFWNQKNAGKQKKVGAATMESVS